MSTIFTVPTLFLIANYPTIQETRGKGLGREEIVRRQGLASQGGGGGVLRYTSDWDVRSPFSGFEICDLRPFFGFEIL